MTLGLRRWSSVLLIGAACLAGSACTTVLDHPVRVVDTYPPAQRIPINVALVLTEELRNAKLEDHVAGDTLIIPFGEHLARNSESMAQRLFSAVTVQKDLSGVTDQDVAAALIPRMVFVEQSLGIWVWSDAMITMGLEWTLKDRQGAIVWIDTVKGTGTTNMGNAFTGRARMRERAGLVVDDVFRKSFDAIAGAQAIKDFASKHEAGVLPQTR
jgi:hypothetical protein